MNKTNISIYGNKVLLEIISEVKLFSKFNIKYFEDLNLCIKNAEKNNQIVIFFITDLNKSVFNNAAFGKSPYIFVVQTLMSKSLMPNELSEQLKIPFTIFDLEKRITALIARVEFKKNSLIGLNHYTIDKNERKIKKGNVELRLSEKEIEFLISFSKTSEPISKDEVLQNVWNYSSESETHTVETHIHRLRKKIEKKFGDSNFIKNNNKGYYI